MSTAVPAPLRSQVVERAKGCCAYCRSTEQLMGVAFEIDHIVPRAVGGETSFDNLCVSRQSCNRHKAARIAAFDARTGASVPLFHPNTQSWSAHFRWSGDGTEIIGLTATGRATVQALNLNRPKLVQTRHYWIALGLHPPTD